MLRTWISQCAIQNCGEFSDPRDGWKMGVPARPVDYVFCTGNLEKYLIVGGNGRIQSVQIVHIRDVTLHRSDGFANLSPPCPTQIDGDR